MQPQLGWKSAVFCHETPVMLPVSQKRTPLNHDNLVRISILKILSKGIQQTSPCFDDKRSMTWCTFKNLIPLFCGRVLILFHKIVVSDFWKSRNKFVSKQAKTNLCLKTLYLYVVFTPSFCELNRSFFSKIESGKFSRFNFYSNINIWKEVQFRVRPRNVIHITEILLEQK